MGFLQWLETSALGLWIRESDWGYPIILNGHAVGMAMVVGIVLMLSIRVIGYSKGMSLTAFDKLIAVAWLGFALNATTGTLLFIGKGRQFITNPAFLIKILLIACGGLSVWLLMRTLDESRALVAEGEVPGKAKAIAGILIAFWLGAIIAGRLIGYTLGPPLP